MQTTDSLMRVLIIVDVHVVDYCAFGRRPSTYGDSRHWTRRHCCSHQKLEADIDQVGQTNHLTPVDRPGTNNRVDTLGVGYGRDVCQNRSLGSA